MASHHQQYPHNYDNTDEYYDIDDNDVTDEEEEAEDKEDTLDIDFKNKYENYNPRKPKWIKEWNKLFVLVCVTGLFVDPLFFYAISISENRMCLFVDGWFAITVTVLRFMTDALHVWNMWSQLKMMMNCRHRPVESNDSTGALVGVLQFFKSRKGLLLDLFVILPLPQIILWVGVPSLLGKGSTSSVMSLVLITFLLQYLPKIYHSVCFLCRTQNFSGYIFGTVRWGVALNLIAYFVASHAIGACWYLLGIQRAAKCLKMQCKVTNGCDLRMLACEDPLYYGATSRLRDKSRLIWGESGQARSTCLGNYADFNYGVYNWTVKIVTHDNRVEKILFPIFWGLMTLCTFANLQSTTDWLEIVFVIIVVTAGLLLVTMLIGNIRVFMQAAMSKKQDMHLKMMNVEWWMKERRLPLGFRQRVRNYERQRWAAMRGVDERDLLYNLPEGLRRDIKYHLCLDLVRQVPLFQHMDELVLENICDRVKSLIFTKGETITREGDPVQRMLFIVRGHLQSSQVLRDGVKSCCMLGPGNFTGDEFLYGVFYDPL